MNEGGTSGGTRGGTGLITDHIHPLSLKHCPLPVHTCTVSSPPPLISLSPSLSHFPSLHACIHPPLHHSPPSPLPLLHSPPPPPPPPLAATVSSLVVTVSKRDTKPAKSAVLILGEGKGGGVRGRAMGVGIRGQMEIGSVDEEGVKRGGMRGRAMKV